MTFTTVINSLWNLYWVTDPGGIPEEVPAAPTPWGSNGLAGLWSPSQASVSTGTAYGPVRVTVEVHDVAPALDLDPWTDVVELPFQVVGPRPVVFTDWGGAPFHELRVKWGTYRLRIHARGRDEGRARRHELTMDDPPVEEHLIQLFPGAGGEVVYKTEDQNGAMLRGGAPPETPPKADDAPPEPAAVDYDEFERRRQLILSLTADMRAQDQQYIVELIAAQVARPVDEPPSHPEPEPFGPSMEEIVALAIARMPPELQGLVGNAGIQNVHVRHEATVWVFHGEGAPFAAGVFATEQEGLRWAARWSVSGILTEYPVGEGCYDIAVRDGHFRPSKPHHGTADHVARFSPGWTRHVHLDGGGPAS